VLVTSLYVTNAALHRGVRLTFAMTRVCIGSAVCGTVVDACFCLWDKILV